MRNDVKGAVAFPILYGPEVRAFLHSGLVAKVSMIRPVVLISAKDLSQYGPIPEGVHQEVVRDLPKERRLLGKVRSIALASQSRLLRQHGRRRWAHYLEWAARDRRRSPGRVLFQARPVAKLTYHCGSTTEKYFGTFLGTEPFVHQIYRKWDVRLLVASSFFSPRVQPFLQTAQNTRCSIVVITNSWKDVYTTTHVPATAAKIVLNSSRAARALLDVNPHLKASQLATCASLHLESLFHDAAIPRYEFCKSVGLDPAKQIICYSAASPQAVRDEEKIVEYLATAIGDGLIGGNPQLLLRLNPMESNPERFRERLKGFRFVHIQHPKWIWEQERDWCAACREDVDLWRATIAHSAINVSIPSTVTLEFLMDQKSVVNVAFDFPDPLPHSTSNRRFWKSEYYRILVDHPSVFPAFTPGEFVDRVQAALKAPFRAVENELIQVDRTPPVPCAVGLIQKVLDAS